MKSFFQSLVPMKLTTTLKYNLSVTKVVNRQPTQILKYNQGLDLMPTISTCSPFYANIMTQFTQSPFLILLPLIHPTFTFFTPLLSPQLISPLIGYLKPSTHHCNKSTRVPVHANRFVLTPFFCPQFCVVLGFIFTPRPQHFD